MAAGVGGNSNHAPTNRTHRYFVAVIDLVGHSRNAARLAARAIDSQPRHGTHQVLVTANVVGMPMRRQHSNQLKTSPAYLGQHLVRLGAVDYAALLAGFVDYQVGV